MKFGVWTPTHWVSGWDVSVKGPAENQRQIYRDEPRDPGYDVSLETVRAADAAGFASTLILQRLNGPDGEAWVMASALASLTRQMEIMTAVQPGLWSPAMAAKMGATIDRLSGGRFAANLIAGWNADEQVVYGGTGLLKEDPDARYRRAKEFVSLVRALWTEDEVSYEGEFYRLDKASVQTKPWNGRIPPFYAAARSEAGCEFVASSADCWFVDIEDPISTFEAALERTRVQIAAMNERAARYGRKMRYAMQAYVVHNEDEKAARAEADEIHRRALTRTDPRQIEVGLIGSAARIAERIAMYEALGVELLLFKFSPWLDGVKVISEQIFPLTR